MQRSVGEKTVDWASVAGHPKGGGLSGGHSSPGPKIGPPKKRATSENRSTRQARCAPHACHCSLPSSSTHEALTVIGSSDSRASPQKQQEKVTSGTSGE